MLRSTQTKKSFLTCLVILFSCYAFGARTYNVVSYDRKLHVVESTEKDLHVGPDHTKGPLHIEGVTSSHIIVYIFNQWGKNVKTINLDNSHDFSIADLPGGDYEVMVDDGEHVVSSYITRDQEEEEDEFAD